MVPCPAIVNVFDLIPLEVPEDLPSPRERLLYRLFMSLSLRQASRIVVSTEATARALARFKMPAKMTRVVPLAADARFAPAPREAVKVVESILELPARFLLYVGINKPHKNLPRLVRAFAHVRRAQPDLHLVLAGPCDPRYSSVAEQIEALGLSAYVHVLGPVAEDILPALYTAAEVFVFPSLAEGFGLPVLEAMACGTPVACAKVPALQEVAADAACYFDPCDPDKIADAIRQILDDPAPWRAAGLARAARFSWQTTASAMLALYKEVLPA